jgi:mannose-6-phosphate isomerase-like protein (cupin superfamily)
MRKVTLSEHHLFSPEKMQKVALFESDFLFYDLYCLESGQAQKVHSHDGSDKIYLALEGRPTVQVGEEREELEPGQAALAPAGQDHGVHNTSGERAVLLVVMAPKP